MKTDFDESIGKINIIPQDIGRVLLNLYNNAFYAVNEKMKTADENYQPSVSVETKKINDKVILTVMDNGNGIPQKVVDKIFQPFFTTKPTGQGIGLGLSLSYDIVKARWRNNRRYHRRRIFGIYAPLAGSACAWGLIIFIIHFLISNIHPR
ncbi:MAG TPA: ATP-binding protein [Puia sp.]|jgi:two-component system NtrC family sensor kinase|nr:ATP-binding protein [Puia sp.]